MHHISTSWTNPSIVYAPQSLNPFLIYTGENGLQSMYCYDVKCQLNANQTLIRNVSIFSTSLLSIDVHSSTQNCSKVINHKLYYCSYYMLVSYGTASKSKNMLVFLICYDNVCDIQNIDDIIIDSSTETSYLFGYSTSLTTYFHQAYGQILPMFTYSKYDTTQKQYILNVIICLDMFCNTYYGKESDNPPYVALGTDADAAKYEVSIQETWYYGSGNYLSLMYTKAYGVNIAVCGLNSTANGVSSCDHMVGDELESKSILNNQYLSKNYVSMVEYLPSKEEKNTPIMIATYTVNNTQNNDDELWILYCFNLFCDSQYRLSYKLWSATKITYPIIDVRYAYYFPYIAFFQDSKDLVFMNCEYAVNPWNCTQLLYNHPTTVIYEYLSNLDTDKMQISVVANLIAPQQSLMLSSIVQSDSYLGLEFVNCETADCNINERQHISK